MLPALDLGSSGFIGTVIKLLFSQQFSNMAQMNEGLT